MKKVIYSCITGGYDDIPLHKYIAPDWNYVLFTDNQNLIEQKHFSHWEIRPLVFDKLTNVKNARWHKVNAHKLFPEYDISLWIDSNIIINNDNIFKLCDDLIVDNVMIAVPNHPKRRCIYDEAEIIKELKIDYSEIVDSEMSFLHSENYPANNGLAETCILFRRHNKIIPMLNLWWYMIQKYSKRDQLSFNYALWKFNIPSCNIYIDENGFGIHRKIDTFSFVHKKSHDQNRIIPYKKFIPKFIGRIICLFIPNTKCRKLFRKKYIKE